MRKNLPPPEDFNPSAVAEPADAWPRTLGLSSWTKADVDAARADLSRGIFRRPVSLWRSAKTDAAIYAAALNRIAPMAGLPLELDAGCPDGHAARPGGLGERAMAEASARFLGGECDIPFDVLADVNEELAVFGVSVCQVVRSQTDAGDRVNLRLENWPLEHTQHYETAPDGGRGLYASTTEGWVPIVHGDGRWVVFSAHAQEPWNWGALIALSDVWASRAFARRDRSKSGESQGDSKWIATMPEGMSTKSPEGKEMLAQVLALYNRRRAMLKPFGSVIERNEAMSQNWQIFKEIISSDDSDAAKILLGQDVSDTAVSSQRLSFAQLFGIRNDLVERDLTVMARQLNTGLIRPWQAMNFGRIDLVRGIAWRFPDFDQDQRRESLAKRELDLATIVKARRDAQLPVTQTWIDCLCRDLGVQTFVLPDLAASGSSVANPLATPIGAQSKPAEGPDLPANDSGSVAAE